MSLLLLETWHSTQLCSLAALTGAVAHALYFVRGHHDHYALVTAVAHAGAGTLLAAVAIAQRGLVAGVGLALALSTCYLGALFGSIAVYRLFLHPLARFPGPVAARLTKLYGPWIARNGRMHWEHSRLIAKYGPIVRIAPNELLVASVGAIQSIHGATSRCDKSREFYAFVTVGGVHTLDSVGTKAEHRKRRVVWDQAMSSSCQVAYEQRGHATIEDWLAKLAELDGAPINTSLYALLLPFDNIGRVGFSQDFGMVRSGKETELLRLLGVGLAAAGKLGQMGWPIGLFRSLGLTPDEDKLDVYLDELIEQRIKDDSPDKQDIMSTMLADMRAPAPRSITSRGVLRAEVGAILGGGTDTIGVVLAYAFYHLAASKPRQAALRASIAPAHGATAPGRFDDRDLEPLADLAAFVDEVLRLHSPACNNGSRTVPAGGLTVDLDGASVHVPGGASVLVPIHSLQTDARYFADPLAFAPERWTAQPDLVHDRRAFHPFLVGPYNCVGQRLARRFVRLALASTLWAYDVEFAPGEDGRAIHEQAINRLLLKPGPLWCVFRKRGGQEASQI